MEGKQIGHYKILENLGSGGMGKVWLAEDTRLERKVALKFLPQFTAQDEIEKARFIQEAKAAAKLSHANIAQVYEIGEEEERLYIVMEYVPGGSLRDVLDKARGKSLPLEKVLTWVQQTADGLAEAHSHGIIHRDIKPDNLMLTDKGQIKITDFGLARLEAATRLTASGTTLGTVNYTSPELIAGREVDHRSDLFSLGATFYELLTGQQAFTGSDTNSIYYAILNARIDPLARYRNDLPRGISSILDKLLERDVRLRYQSAIEVSTDILRIQDIDSRPSIPVVRARFISRLRAIPRSLVLILGLSIGMLIGIVSTRSNPAQFDYSQLRWTIASGEPETELRGSWSPQGTDIAYLAMANDGLQLFVRDADSRFSATQRTFFPKGVSSDGQVFWHPTEDLIYCISDDTLWSVGSTAGDPQYVLGNNVTAADITPEADAIVFISDDGLNVSEPIGAPPRQYEWDGNVEFNWMYIPVDIQISPDGKWIGLSKEGNGGEGFFWLFPWPDNSGSSLLNPFRQSIRDDLRSFNWLPGSNRIIFTFARTAGLWSGDIRTGELQSLTPPNLDESYPTVSPDGRLLITRLEEDYNIIEVPFHSGAPRSLRSTEFIEVSPTWSLDGRLLAYHRRDPGGNQEIRIWNLASDTDESVIDQRAFSSDFDNPVITQMMALSPDGEIIAFIVGSTTGFSHWLLRWRSNQRQPALPLGTFDTDISSCVTWSPDSAQLAFRVRAESDGPRQIVVVKAGDPDSYRTLPDGTNGLYCLWSPDGKWIATFKDNDIWLLPPDGSSATVIETDFSVSRYGFAPLWSSDSSRIYLALTQPENRGLYAIDIRNGSSYLIRELPEELDISSPITFATLGHTYPGAEGFVTSSHLTQADLYFVDGIAGLLGFR